MYSSFHGVKGGRGRDVELEEILYLWSDTPAVPAYEETPILTGGVDINCRWDEQQNNRLSLLPWAPSPTNICVQNLLLASGNEEQKTDTIGGEKRCSVSIFYVYCGPF